MARDLAGHLGGIGPVQPGRRPRELAHAGPAGLAPMLAVGILGRRNNPRIMRHQAQPAFEHSHPAPSRTTLDVLHRPHPGAVVVTSPGANGRHDKTSRRPLPGVCVGAVA